MKKSSEIRSFFLLYNKGYPCIYRQIVIFKHMKKIYLFIIITFLSLAHFSQGNETGLNFSLLFGKEKLELDKEFYSNSDTLQFQTIRFYVSNVKLYKQNKETVLLKKYHLVDLENPTSLFIPFQNENNWDSVSFEIGIDSVTNSNGAMGGDLDPTNGMYWTWNSGYINVKIEGKSINCGARKNKFQFHLGGYQSPFATLQKINTPINNNTILVDFETLFSNTNLQTTHTIMSPGKNAVDFSHLFSSSFNTTK